MSSVAASKNDQAGSSHPPPYDQSGVGYTAGYGQPPGPGPFTGQQAGHTVITGQSGGQTFMVAQHGQGMPQGYGPMMSYPSNTVVVQQPGQYYIQPSIRPPDYLILSIISIFFCWPMAICAIMYSCNSKTSSDSGNFIRGESEGRTARNVGIAAIIIGIIIIAVAVCVPVAISASYYNRHGYYY